VKYIFVIPPTNSFVSGGNVYNQKFIDGLRHICPVSNITWENFKLTKEIDATLIVDSIYIDKVEKSLSRIVSKKILLIHYLDIFYDEKNNQSLIQQRKEQLKLFDYYIVTGQYSFEWLIQNGYSYEKIILLSPCIEISGTKKNKSAGGIKNILMVGNLLPVKGYLPFLKLLMEKNISNLRFTIIGDETIDRAYATCIRSLINSSEYLKSIGHIADTVQHNRITEYYEENDALISPSFFETFGMAIQEALSYGMEVFAFNGGNVAYINHPLLKSFDTHERMIEYLSEWAAETRSTQFSPIRKPDFLNHHKLSWDELAIEFHTQYTNRMH
jgi:hypothetical protein